MSPARIVPRPRDLVITVLSAAAAAHTAFIIVLSWLRPDIGMSGVASFFVLGFIVIATAFIPIVLAISLLRIVILRYVPGVAPGSLLLMIVLAVAGVAIATGLASLVVELIRNDSEITSSALFGAAVGGVIGGLRLSREEGGRGRRAEGGGRNE
jgi:hypothetical protein